jgi:acyl-CoA dehydrogenase
VALIHLGGALKRKEMISARLGDVLSELYLLSCVLKRHHTEGRPADDQPLVDWCCLSGFATIERAFDRVFNNYPSRPLAWMMRAVVLPWGRRQRGPDDDLTRQVADLIMAPGEVRDRLTTGVFRGTSDDGVGKVEAAFDRVIATAALRRRLDDADVADIDDALVRGLIDPGEHRALADAATAVDDAIAVDHFDAATLSPGDVELDSERQRHRLSVSGRS